MAIKKFNNYYVADYKTDLDNFTNARFGEKCHVIENATDYVCNSEGKWFDTYPDIEVSGGESNVDLTGYATETFVEEAIAKIEIPEVEGVYAPLTNNVFKLFGEAPENMTNDKSIFGICVKAAGGKTLIERMLEKGKGMYNFWVEKGAPGQPDAVIEKNSSCRGLCCLDTYYADDRWYGWIEMFDQDGDMYVQYIRNGEPKGWKTVAFV